MADLPDLSKIPPDRLEALKGSVLANAITESRARLAAAEKPATAFNSQI